MVICRSCHAEVSETGRFCSSCGALLSSDLIGTLGPTIAEPSPTPRSSLNGLSSEGRFLPGTLLVKRYRIVSLLGKGGMGEVYRSDDLLLGQPVALKFLPEAAARNESALERFRSEVRNARRVTHPNVCRVYDVGEAEGQTYLSMEYVDGEDLASLLRRIGRLSADKGLEIARQLCAGLAAAHREGVLHRDLKPANIMLDGRGRAVMTDFGLASLAEKITGDDVRSGTPAYMAPEQLAAKEVTARSDIYSLGLVLFEIFTGKRAYEAEKLSDLVKQRTEKPPSRPSSFVKDIDPAVERVILRCLDADPSNRPASALAVAAALPGGDPLAAALAAGETPSPEMVAAAGQTSGFSPRGALACLAAVILGMGLITFLGIELNGLRKMSGLLPPDVLEHRAREIINSLGYAGEVGERKFGFYTDYDLIEYYRKKEKPSPHWDQVISARPQILGFWYRESAHPMSAQGFQGTSITPGVVTWDDPPATDSGMINLLLDPQGRLTYFQAIPPEYEPNPPFPPSLNWNLLFTSAELDSSHFLSAAPAWNSLAASDTRFAWTGNWPGSNRPLRVEAAAWRGKPVFFSLTGPWSMPRRMQSPSASSGARTSETIQMFMAIAFLAAGCLLAYRNHAKGKGDLRGAARLAGAVFVIELAIWLCRGHLTPTVATFGRFVLAVSTGLFMSGAMLVLYLALEPYVRRHWPHAMISWSRVLMGRLRDPLVGRDLLSGVLLGVAWSLIISTGFLILMRQGSAPQFGDSSLLIGTREMLGAWLANIVTSIMGTLTFFFLLFLLRVLLRIKWLAVLFFVAIYTGLNVLRSDFPITAAVMWLIVYSIAAVALIRFGVVVLATGILTANVLLNIPFTLDFSNWYATNSFAVLLSFIAIAVCGFFISLAGQRLWKDELFE